MEFPIGRRTGEFVITERRYGTPDNGVYAGDGVIITIGPAQREGVAPPALHPTKGIARLRHVGGLDGDEENGWALLVEDEPRGKPIGSARLPEALAVKLAIELAWIIDDAEAPLGGLRPELVYVDGDAVTEIAPRGGPFIASAKPRCYGVVRPFRNWYLAPEQVAATAYEESADVFALGTMLAQWVTGEHPFTGDHDQQIFGIALNRRRPWTGSAALGKIVTEALSPSPAERPLPVELVTALTAHARALE